MDLEREIAALRQRRRSVRPEELHRLLTAAGFSRRFGKGDHWVYTYPQYPKNLGIDPRTPLLVAYVDLALKAVRQVLNANR